jgi:hypothetical protein
LNPVKNGRNHPNVKSDGKWMCKPVKRQCHCGLTLPLAAWNYDKNHLWEKPAETLGTLHALFYGVARAAQPPSHLVTGEAPDSPALC